MNVTAKENENNETDRIKRECRDGFEFRNQGRSCTSLLSRNTDGSCLSHNGPFHRVDILGIHVVSKVQRHLHCPALPCPTSNDPKWPCSYNPPDKKSPNPPSNADPLWHTWSHTICNDFQAVPCIANPIRRDRAEHAKGHS